MPNQTFHKITLNGTYVHIYNAGVDQRTIFNDNQDYETFQGYLKDYLTPPPDKNQVKKTFSVNGKTYRGVPHLPKNYCNQMELVAYSLQPDHFHLVLRVRSTQALQAFMRSLSTRYSMYYNAKYKRSGPLFAGTYKSAELATISQLLSLTQYLHHEPGYTSYQEFLRKRISPYVKPASVLTLFEQSKNSRYKGTNGYQRFVETYTLKANDASALARIILERTKGLPEVQPVMRPVLSDQPDDELTRVSRSRVPEFIAAITIFVLLVAMGIKNVIAVSASTHNDSPMILGIQIMRNPTK